MQLVVQAVFLYKSGEIVMRKKIWIRIVFIMVLIFLAALLRNYFSGSVSEDDSYSKVLGLVLTVTEDEWQDSLIASVTDYAGEYGFEVMTTQAKRSKFSQIEAIRALIVYQANAIVFFPVVDSGWDSVLYEAEKAGIPVIAVDKAVRSNQDGFNISYVGYDYYGDSIAAAKLLAANADEQDIIVELYGTLGSYPAKEITRGFREILSERGLQIQSSICGDYMRSRGKEITEGFLKSEDGIDFIISHNDAMTFGAVDAIEKEGKIPGKDVHIFAVGGSEKAVKMVEEGKITCLIQKDAKELGEKTIEAVNMLFSVDAPREISILLETVLLTKGDTAY